MALISRRRKRPSEYGASLRPTRAKGNERLRLGYYCKFKATNRVHATRTDSRIGESKLNGTNCGPFSMSNTACHVEDFPLVCFVCVHLSSVGLLISKAVYPYPCVHKTPVTFFQPLAEPLLRSVAPPTSREDSEGGGGDGCRSSTYALARSVLRVLSLCEALHAPSLPGSSVLSGLIQSHRWV